MESGNDDERAAAYQRYIFNEFADIVHNYDRTAHVNHDDIVYDQHDLNYFDGAEYDDNGDPVIQYGLVFFFIAASDSDRDGSRDDNDNGGDDDCSFDDDDPYDIAARFFDRYTEDDDHHHDTPSHGYFRFPVYDPRRSPCKRPYGFYYTSRDFPRPPA